MKLTSKEQEITIRYGSAGKKYEINIYAAVEAYIAFITLIGLVLVWTWLPDAPLVAKMIISLVLAPLIVGGVWCAAECAKK